MEVVSFEIAKKLKEKGFRGKCRESYRKRKLISNMTAFNCNTVADIKISYNVLNDAVYTHGMYVDIIDAPTISQVLKWLREEKKIHIIVEISDSGWYYTYYPNIRWEDGKLKSDKYFMSFKHNSSYELAALAGIEYVIDNLI